RLDRRGRPAVRTLLFPRREATLIDSWDAIGLRGTASDSYSVGDLFVPEAFSCSREDPTLRREPGALYAVTMQGLYALGAAGVGRGIARAMLDALLALAQPKAPRGRARLADDPLLRAEVARSEAKLEAAGAYLRETLASVYACAHRTAPIAVGDRA